jgi:hypothetical protein
MKKRKARGIAAVSSRLNVDPLWIQPAAIEVRERPK